MDKGNEDEDEEEEDEEDEAPFIVARGGAAVKQACKTRPLCKRQSPTGPVWDERRG